VVHIGEAGTGSVARQQAIRDAFGRPSANAASMHTVVPNSSADTTNARRHVWRAVSGWRRARR